MAKIIMLTQGKQAVVDDEDFSVLSAYKWYARKDRANYYATRRENKKHIQMHQAILGCPPKGFTIDHINGDGLDNRKSNLRVVSLSVNRLNSRVSSNNTSGYRGVYYSRRDKKWLAKLGYRIDGKIITQHIGRSNCPQKAYAAYCEAVKNRYGVFFSRLV